MELAAFKLDLDYDEMENQDSFSYFNIPKKLSELENTKFFCLDHVLEFFQNYLVENKIYFLQISLPNNIKEEGFMW